MKSSLRQLQLSITIVITAVGMSTISVTQAAPEAPGIVSTVAGNGTSGYSGDGGPAIAASLSSLSGVDVVEAGNLLIAAGATVRRVDTNGIISTIAGPGDPGTLGDGGPATDAYLGFAQDVKSDGQGNIYIASWNGHRVRKIDPLGTITTVAGSGKQGFAGDGGPATQANLSNPRNIAIDSNGNLLFTDYGNSRIRRVTLDGTITTVAGNGSTAWQCKAYGSEDPTQCGDGGPAIQAPLNTDGVGVDAVGNIYVSDAYHIRIRRVSPDGIITTVAGDGGWHPFELGAVCSSNSGPGTLGSLGAPLGMEIDRLGNVYWADWGGLLSCVHKLSAGIISTVAGHSHNCPNYDSLECVLMGPKEDGYPAIYTTLQYVRDVAISPAGDLYFAEQGRVRKVPGGALVSP